MKIYRVSFRVVDELQKIHDVGEKFFTNEDKAHEYINNEIIADNPKVNDLTDAKFGRINIKRLVVIKFPEGCKRKMFLEEIEVE